MSTSLYITSAQPRAGKAVASLGVLEVLAGRVGRIAVFRPIIAEPPDGRDVLIDLLMAQYGLDQPYETSYALTYAEAATLGAGGDPSRLIARVVDAYSELRGSYDFVLCVGTDFTGPAAATELELNAIFAANLGAPVLSVVAAAPRVEDTVAAATSVADMITAHGGLVVATIVNRAQPDQIEQLRKLLAATPSPTYVLSELPVLASVTLAEVVAATGGTVLAGETAALQREVEGFMTGSGYLQTVLNRLTDNLLLIASGDRIDLAIGAAAAARSPNLPTPAGVVLSNGSLLDEKARTLLQAAELPVVVVETNTYSTMHLIDGLHGEIRPHSRRKIAAALREFAAAVDTTALADRVQLSRSEVVTPTMFAVTLAERARAERRHIVLPEGEDDRVLLATDELTHGGIAELTLLGDPARVRARAERLGVALNGVHIVDPITSGLRREFATTYAEARARKGVTFDLAYDLMADVAYFGTLLVATGRVDGMVSGAAHTTAHTIRPALELLRDPSVSLVSSAFFMCLPERVLVFADCAVNPNPTALQLADIAITTADTAARFGIEPAVAMVSYATGMSSEGVDVDKVRQATTEVAARRPDLPLAGPIQYDAAVDPTTGATKMPGNPVAGRATVLIFPDLNTGNTTYKAVQRAARAVAVGPVLQGLRRPVNDLSRGCTIPDIVNTVAITAIQAQTEPA